MAVVASWLPPTREHWELVTYLWQFFPLFTVVQWFNDYYPQGKTSIPSSFNIPGKIAWAVMETPGFVGLLFCMFTIPATQGIEKLPVANWLMAALFSIHYIYRAIISPLFLNPSMSPIHPLILISAFSFQVINGTCIGGYLAGYGASTQEDWAGATIRIQVGLLIFFAGFIGNMWHDDELREIRRVAARKQKQKAKAQGEKGVEGKVDKVYEVPENGLFRLILYPHFFCEWVEWCGFWIIGGWGCVPARTFVINEMTTMIPRALSGKRWYIQRFGKEKIGSRRAVIPGLI